MRISDRPAESVAVQVPPAKRRSFRPQSSRPARLTAVRMSVLLLLGTACAAHAQVKIGENPVSINPGSVLELESTNRGLLVTRIALTDRTVWGLSGNQPVDGMVVFNTTAGNGVNGLQQGLAVWKGGQWVSADETPYFHTNSTLVGNSTLSNSGATGANAIAVGPNAAAFGASAVAVGLGANAASNNSVAVGQGANASNGGLVAIGMGAQSLAQNTIAIGGTASVRLGIAIGFASNSAGNGAVAIGDATTSSAFSTVALGQSAVATNDYAISMGRQANAGNVRTTSLGANSTASGTAATAIGSNSAATGNYATATGSRVYLVDGVPREDAYVPGIGFPSATTTTLDTQATGLLSAAYGSGAVSAGSRSLALGSLSSASTDGSVALGSGSTADRAVAPTTGSIPAGSALVSYNTTDRTLLGAVSVGNATSYRQITNVADGTQAQDAVTVRQLTGALQSFAVTPIQYFHAKSSAADSLAVGAESVAVGPRTVVNGDSGVGIGNGAVVQQSATGGVAIGTGSSVAQPGGVALGAGSTASTAAGLTGYVPATATDAQRAAIGATTSTQAAVSVGDAAGGQYRQITGVAAGTANSDAVNVSQLKAVQGTVAVIDQSTVKYDTNADGSTNYNSVTMGGSNTTAPVAVHNVANGVAPNDAVNVQQLNSTAAGINNRVNALSDQVNRNTKMLSGGIAASAAMAVVTPVEPGRYHVSGAVAGYNGESGIGFNILKRSDNGQTTLHAGVGWGSGGGKAIVRVGFGFSFD